MSDEIAASRKRPCAFISHHSSNVDEARTVKQALARSGIDGWMAPDDIEPGSSFDEAIVRQLKRSDAVVLLFDANADASRHVKRELKVADDAGTPIFPVRLEATEAQGLTYWLSDQQRIDWIGGKGDGLERLAAAILRRAEEPGRASEPASLPRKPAPRRSLRIGAAAALAAVAIGAALLLGRGGGVTETVIEPGRWIAKREVIAITFPELPADVKEQIAQSFENDPDPEECITQAVARAPGVELFDPGGKGKCTLTSFKMTGGRLSGYLSCPLPSTTDGSVMTVTFRGSYTRTSVELENDIMVSRPGAMVKLRAKDSTQWMSKDCSK